MFLDELKNLKNDEVSVLTSRMSIYRGTLEKGLVLSKINVIPINMFYYLRELDRKNTY